MYVQSPDVISHKHDTFIHRVAALSRLMTAGAQPPKPCAASYICELTRVPGKFLPAKAQELGVPRGHLYGVLKRGQPVTLQDGTTIQPHQVRPRLQVGNY